jgi:hypothetical protein
MSLFRLCKNVMSAKSEVTKLSLPSHQIFTESIEQN